MTRLMDVFLDGAIERSLFEEKKLALLLERKGLEEQLIRIRDESATLEADLEEYLGPLKDLTSSYESANTDEKRRLTKIITSDLVAEGKNLSVELKSPFREIAQLNTVRCGAPHRRTPRTVILRKIFNTIARHCTAEAKKDEHRPAQPIEMIKEQPRQKGWENIERVNRERKRDATPGLLAT